MRIAIPTEESNGLDAFVSMNFARAPFFTVVDLDSATTISYPNPYAQGGGGVGPMVVQWIASLGANAVVTPSIGPNAVEALISSGLIAYSCPPGARVREIVDFLKRGQLHPAALSQPPALGIGPGVGPGGPGVGMGWRRGGGRGRKGKRGRREGWSGGLMLGR